MKTRTYLTASQLVGLYEEYEKTLSYRLASEKYGVVYSTGYRAIRTLSALLAGEKIDRKKTASEFLIASRTLIKMKESPAAEEGPNAFIPVGQIDKESDEDRINRHWEELKTELVEYAYNKALSTVAKNSNIASFLNERMNRA